MNNKYNISPNYARDNPHRTYKLMRENDPFYKEPNGLQFITRYDHVKAILSNHKTFGSAGTSHILLPEWLSNTSCIRDYILAFEDQPSHTAHRKLLANVFKKHLSESPEDHIIKTAINLIEKIEKNEPLEFLSSVAFPFVLNVANKQAGITNTEIFPKWKDWIHLIESPPMEYNQTYVNQLIHYNKSISAYFLNLVQLRRQSLTNDIISSLINESSGNDNISDETICELLELLIHGGIQPSMHFFLRAIIRLSHTPDLFTQLKYKRSDLDLFIDELLRFDTQVHFMGRKCIATTRLLESDISIQKNSPLALGLASANRDHRVFSDPDVFDIYRANNNKHLTFSTGIHRCIGASIAKIQLNALLTAILDRFSSVSCPPSNQLPWFYTYTTHSVKYLHVTLK